MLKVDVPILPCVFYTFNWLTLTSEMFFVRFHPEVTSCLLSRGKTKFVTLGMRLWCKYIRNYLLVYQLTSHFLPYLQNYKEFEGEISDLQVEKYGLSFETKKYTTYGWARGDENVIGIRAFNLFIFSSLSQISSKNSFGKVVFQNLAKIEMTRNKNRLFGRILKRNNIFQFFFKNWDFFIARTYMVQISLQNSGGKVVFSGGFHGTPPPLGHQPE